MAPSSSTSTSGHTHGLRVTDLTVRFGETVAVDHVDLEVPAGSVVAVLGPSGCGKSTLLRAVAGLEVPASGAIEYDGQDLASTPTHKRGFALMFQDGQLFEHLDVAANIAYPLRLRHSLRATGAGLPARSGSPSCSSSSVSRGTPTARRGPSREASASGWRSRAPWPSTRGCSCSTSH